MKSYAQNKEDLIIFEYFQGFTGTLLSIGENDGTTFSNARLLIEQGWAAHLVEPGNTFRKLQKLHVGNSAVGCHNFGIGLRNERLPFFESGAHVARGKDRGLVSSLVPEETERWRQSGVNFEESEIQLYDFQTFYKSIRSPKLEFISIDCEGYDWFILSQINLQAVGCRVLCIEWNGDVELKRLYKEKCAGYRLLHQNAENLIFML